VAVDVHQPFKKNVVTDIRTMEALLFYLYKWIFQLTTPFNGSFSNMYFPFFWLTETGRKTLSEGKHTYPVEFELPEL